MKCIFIFLLLLNILTTRRSRAFKWNGFHNFLWFGRAKSLLSTFTIRLICFVPTLLLWMRSPLQYMSECSFMKVELSTVKVTDDSNQQSCINGSYLGGDSIKPFTATQTSQKLLFLVCTSLLAFHYLTMISLFLHFFFAFWFTHFLFSSFSFLPFIKKKNCSRKDQLPWQITWKKLKMNKFSKRVKYSF